MKFIKQDLIIASRSSSLALKQCEIFKEYLKNINTSVLKIVTTGDKIIDKQLHEFGGKGLFVKGLENALLDNKADVAVHSMKDMEWIIAKGTRIAAVLPRGSRRSQEGLWPRACGGIAAFGHVLVGAQCVTLNLIHLLMPTPNYI